MSMADWCDGYRTQETASISIEASRMASKSSKLQEGRLRESYQFTRYGEQPQDALATSLAFGVNAPPPPPILILPSPHSTRGSIHRPPALLYREAVPCERATRRSRAELLAKVPLPPQSAQSERWPTTRLHCPSGAGRDDVRGTNEHS